MFPYLQTAMRDIPEQDTAFHHALELSINF